MATKATEIAEVVAKLIAAVAVLGATFVANQYQSSMAASNLLSQREQADTTLRAGMFRDLIGPVVGTQDGNNRIPAVREALLAELLALNFHEHFELKPVMVHVDQRLATEAIPDMSEAERTAARNSLRSAAHRVVARQLAMLTKVEKGSAPGSRSCVVTLNLAEHPISPPAPAQKPASSAPKASAQSQKPPSQSQTPRPCSGIDTGFGQLVEVISPNGLYTVYLAVSNPNWDDQSFTVMAHISFTNDNAVGFKPGGQDFQLTWFDFPYIDNILLSDGTRFSLSLDRVNAEKKTARINLTWFPQNYFAARERPTNYQQLRDRLGLQLE